MTAPELIGAPYAAPAVRAGDWLDDEIDGRVEVGGWTSAPLSWPRRKKTGRPSLILTAELARAVRIESVDAICHWWGVRPTKVWMWRKALGVERITEGTRKLLQERTGVPPEASARGRVGAATPEARAKISASKLGKPAHPETKAGLLRAAKRKKSAEWSVKANAWMLGRELPALHKGEWTVEELTYLRDAYSQGKRIEAMATKLGRTPDSVRGQATRMGLSSRQIEWSAADDALLVARYRELGPTECAKLLSRSVPAVSMRAMLLQLRKEKKSQNDGSPKRWSPEDDQTVREKYRAIGAYELSKLLRRTVSAVRDRAEMLGVTGQK